jgi:hypothetical protein
MCGRLNQINIINADICSDLSSSGRLVQIVGCSAPCYLSSHLYIDEVINGR